jgi:two-component system, sensor histidine kinase YesM
MIAELLVIAVCLVVLCLLWMLRALHYFYQLKTGMQQIGKGDYRFRFRLKNKRLFMGVLHQFNEMAEAVELFARQIDQTTVQRTELEVKSLQAQINPHFLYNTLSSISRLVKLGKVEHAHSMLLALAKFYRLTLNEEKAEYYIAQEIQHVSAYMEIQQIKYRELVTFTYEVKDELLEHVTLRMILQPFVENAMKHAFFGDPMVIRLTIDERDERIVFSIMDNGLGMPSERLDAIFHANGETGMGIANVHHRIQLHYGEEYGVRLESRPGAGTTVTIEIPKD